MNVLNKINKNIIKVNKEDLVTIVKYKIKMFEDANLIHLLEDDPFNTILIKYQKLYDDEKATHLLIKENNQIIAICGCFIKDEIPYCFYKENYGFIGDMYTLPDYRGKGHAKALLEKSLEWFQNINIIQLLADKNVKHIYEKFGFIDNDYLMEMNLNNFNL